jgi:hypothetical protein
VFELHTLLQRLQTFKGDLELIRVTELGWVVEDVDAQERYDRHLEQVILSLYGAECRIEWEPKEFDAREGC